MSEARRYRSVGAELRFSAGVRKNPNKIADAVSFHKRGKLRDAEKIFLSILEKDPTHFEANYFFGVMLLQRNEIVEAEQLIAKAVEKDPCSLEAVISHANALRSLARFDDALTSYDRALVLKPNVPEILNDRGTILLQLKRFDEALESFERAIALKRDFTEALCNRGIALKNLHRFEDALASYDIAIRLKMNYAEAYSNRGNVFMELKDFQAALASYDRAIKFKPDYVEAFKKRGNVLHELKRYDEALASYNAALNIRPDDAPTLNNRGLVLQALDRSEEALDSYDKAIAINPNYAAALNNRGGALHALKGFDEAVASYDRAISLEPNYVAALSNRGVCLNGLKRFDEAIVSCDRAITIDSTYPQAHFVRGSALVELSRIEEGLACYDNAIALKPDFPEAFNGRSMVFYQLKLYDDALTNSDKAIAIKPDFAEALNNRGVILYDLKRFDEALASYNKAIVCKPDFAEAFNNRGIILLALSRFDESLASYCRAIEIKPNYPEAFSNIALCLHALKRFDEALVSFDRAIALNPNYADGYKNRAFTKLLIGRYNDGWSDYEWRWSSKDFPSKPPSTGVPLWHDEDLTGRHLLVFAEQGLGDVIQFVRYLPMLAERNCRVSFLTTRRLIRLLRKSMPQIEFVNNFKQAENIDYQISIMSLPHRFNTELDTIPKSFFYLKSEPDLEARWKTRIGLGNFNIGIAWQGSPEGKIDDGRSIPLSAFVPLSRIPGVRLISLQKKFGLDQLQQLPRDVKIETFDDLDEGADGFIDTAALMSSLDLIITSDTSIAHLAGALGRPTWVVLKHVPDWRWLLDREDSPWYPTVRLFRQMEPGSGRSAFDKVEAELRSKLSKAKTDPSQNRIFEGSSAIQNPTTSASTIQTELKKAIALHQRGELIRAEQICREILKVHFDHSDTIHLLGVVLLQQRQILEGERFIAKALQINPNNPGALNNHGNALRELNRFSEALAKYERAIALKSDYSDAYLNRSICLRELGHFDEALESIDRAISLVPTNPEFLRHRGNILKRLKRFNEALESYDRVLAIKPDCADVLNSRAIVLKELTRHEEAQASYDKAISIRPDYAEALRNRGVMLRGLKRYDDALADFDKAIAIKPKYAQAFNSRGIALNELKRFDEAMASYREAIALRPDYGPAYINQGVILTELKCFDEAIASFDKGIALNPDQADGYKNRAFTKLLIGSFQDGWDDYERRWDATDFPSKRPNITVPVWSGEDLSDRHLLIFTEQGLGDILQFVRYLPLLSDGTQGKCKITFWTAARLVRLLRLSLPHVEIATNLSDVKNIDYQIPLISLPHRFNTKLTTIPREIPYLKAESELKSRWKTQIGSHGFKIGIAWAGNPTHSHDQERSIPLEAFIPLSRLPGIRLISLQKNFGLDQLARLPKNVNIERLGDDLDNGPDAFIDTAAVMSNLDLIITSDTSIAHLAGGLGCPTWVALKYVPDWRWMLDREDSPWYPTMRLFRQTVRNDWPKTFSKIEKELSALLESKPAEIMTSQATTTPSPTVQISWGELIDKITILEIKQRRLTSTEATANVRRELAVLTAAENMYSHHSDLKSLKDELRLVNEALWEIEDKIRQKEASKLFDQEFIELARSVYINNDKRANLKRKINGLLGSPLVEEKQYSTY